MLPTVSKKAASIQCHAALSARSGYTPSQKRKSQKSLPKLLLWLVAGSSDVAEAEASTTDVVNIEVMHLFSHLVSGKIYKISAKIQ